MFKKHARFDDAPIRIAIVNTLDDIASDFVEASRRQLERDFGLQIELIRERRVRVLNEKNLESAVRVIEKESPHVLLAFFGGASDDENHDNNASYLKSLTLGRGIASHVVYEDVLHDPDAMPLVLMSLLAKVGNTPFVLAEPLEYADYVVGLDIIRQVMSKGDRVASLARIYKSDGEFVRYAMEMLELETDEALPYIILQSLLPMQDFEGKRIIIHHAGELDRHLAHMLRRWAEAMGASIYVVEIMRQTIPRIYELGKGITAPGWGTLFRLNGDEAFLIASYSTEGTTPKPLHLRSASPQLPIEFAAYSVLVWTLLHYGEAGRHQLPVTIHHDEAMRQWLARGILPEQTVGDVPFWL